MDRERPAQQVENTALASDGDLAARAAQGSEAAFEELYRRHSQASWRVAQAVTGNRDDAADAVSEAFTKVLKALGEGRLKEGVQFRPYLLAATRNAGIDVLRRSGRQRPTDEIEDTESPVSGPSERAVHGVDEALVASAFRSLPERWRSVLWLTEVEGIPPREAAEMLGVSANGVAQLAVRARNGLRERFLQAHLRNGTIGDDCRFTVERLGAYVAGGLAPRDIAKVDQHLAGCEPCRAKREELEEVGTSLRRVLIPIPLALGAVVFRSWRDAAGAATAAASTAGSAATTTARALPGWAVQAQRPLAALSVALFAAGIIGAGVVGQEDSPRGVRPRNDGAGLVAAPPPAVRFDPAVSSAFAPPLPLLADASSTAPSATPAGESAAGASDTDATTLNADGGGLPALDVGTAAPGTPTGGGTDEPAEAPVQTSATITLGGQTAAVSLGAGEDACTGIAAGPVAGGCPPPAGSSSDGVQVDIGGSAVNPDIEIGLP